MVGREQPGNKDGSAYGLVCVECARGAWEQASGDGNLKQRVWAGGGFAPRRLERDALPVAFGQERLLGDGWVQEVSGDSAVLGGGRLVVASVVVMWRKRRVLFGPGSSCLFFAHARWNGQRCVCGLVGRYGQRRRGHTRRQHVSAIQGSRRCAEQNHGAAQSHLAVAVRRSAARDAPGASAHASPRTESAILSVRVETVHSSEAQTQDMAASTVTPGHGMAFLQTRADGSLRTMTPIVVVGKRSRTSALRHQREESMRSPAAHRQFAASPPAPTSNRASETVVGRRKAATRCRRVGSKHT